MKTHLLSVLGVLICIYLCTPFSLSSQVGLDLVFLKNGDVLKGTISIEVVNGQRVYLFSSKNTQQPTDIRPDLVTSLALFDRDAKSRRRVFISTQPEGESTINFFEKLDDTGKYPIFKAPLTEVYYFQMENERLRRIPSNKDSRIAFFDSLLTTTPRMVQPRKLYSEGLRAYKTFSRFLAYPSNRYSNTYYGISFDYGWFSTEALSDDPLFTNLLPDGATYSFSRYGAKAYFNQGLNKKGNLTYSLLAGVHTVQSDGYFTPDNQNDILTYSTRSLFLTGEGLFQYFFWLGDVFPYVALGGEFSFALDQEGLLADYEEIADGLLVSTYSFSPFNSFQISPVFGLGVQVPIYQQYAVDARFSFSSINDKNGDRSIINTFTLGLNLF
jgi:hypothetical protein